MKQLRSIAAVLFIAVLLVQSAPAQNEIGKWKRFEIALHNPFEGGNPFNLELKGVFQSPSGRTLQQYGFFAGDNVWKIFFMPDEIGEWTYKTKSPDGDLNGKTGTFTCVPSDLPGMLSGDGPHWILKDKGGAFPIVWNPPVPDGAQWGFRGRKASDPAVQNALAFAAETVGARLLGFDALFLVSTGWAKDWPQSALPFNAGEEGLIFHLPFWDELNAKLDAARDLGMGHYIMFYSDDEQTPDRFGFTPQSKRELRFFRYALARLSPYPIVLWDTGIDISEYRSNAWNDWFVDWIGKNDPWRHPVGSRSGGGSGGAIPTDASYFSAGGYLPPSRDELVNEYWKVASERSIPIAHTDHWRPYISRGNWNHNKIRVVHWRCALSGGQAPYPDYNKGKPAWDDVTGQGSHWIGYASKFFNDMLHDDLRKLAPNDTIVRGNDGAIAAANPGNEYVVYLENGGAFQIDLPKTDAPFEARWYNPRTGEYSEPIRKIDKAETVTFTPPTKGEKKDWALHVYQTNP